MGKKQTRVLDHRLYHLTLLKGKQDMKKYLFYSIVGVFYSILSIFLYAEDNDIHYIVNELQDIQITDDSNKIALIFYFENHKIIHSTQDNEQQLILYFENITLPEDILIKMKHELLKKEMIKSINIEESESIITISFDFNLCSYQILQDNHQLYVYFFNESKDIKNQDKNNHVISVNFQNMPITHILKILAEFNHMNIVITEDLTEKLTLLLHDVLWEDALDTILTLYHLEKKYIHNILYIVSQEKLLQIEQAKITEKKLHEDMLPLTQAYFKIHYADAKEVQVLLTQEAQPLLSENGFISVDQRTNTLLVYDKDYVIKHIEAMIKNIDIPIQQVEIEARIVTIRDNYQQDLGIRWGILHDSAEFKLGGSLDIFHDTERNALSNGLNVNFPVSDGSKVAIQIASLGKNNILDLELSALEKENKAEIIASPKLTTLNQYSASIEQGSEIPYNESAENGATTVRFKKAVLSLSVTPQISTNNTVLLELVVTQDAQGNNVVTPTGEALAIDTQKISTQVLANNQETLVLGGIFQEHIIHIVSKVPFLADIPWLGHFFKRNMYVTEKKELFIFVTPKIIENKNK